MSALLNRRPPPALPIAIITGYLGAGKTTLLNRLLADPGLSSSLVLVNELGDIALDHLFIEKIEGDVVLLSSGCLCCSLRGDLVNVLEDLTRRRDNERIAPFDRIIVETTGLADPAPILQTLMGHPYLVLRYRLDSVVCVVDAVNGVATLNRHREARRQAAMADRIVVSKADLAEAPDRLSALNAALDGLNPSAPRLTSDEAQPDALFGAGLFDPAKKNLDIANWLRVDALPSFGPHHDGHGQSGCGHSHGHGDAGLHNQNIRSFAIIRDAPLQPANLDLFLSVLRAAYGADVLRIKGIVALADDPARPVALHGAQHLLHPLVRLAAWPDGDHRTRIVFIVDGLEPEFLEGLFAAACNETRIDGPDAQALGCNPLKISSGGLLG